MLSVYLLVPLVALIHPSIQSPISHLTDNQKAILEKALSPHGSWMNDEKRSDDISSFWKRNGLDSFWKRGDGFLDGDSAFWKRADAAFWKRGLNTVDSFWKRNGNPSYPELETLLKALTVIREYIEKQKQLANDLQQYEPEAQENKSAKPARSYEVIDKNSNDGGLALGSDVHKEERRRDDQLMGPEFNPTGW